MEERNEKAVNHVYETEVISFDIAQKEIANYLNMQLTVYQRYERGERELPLWAAIKLADYYGVTLDYLVGRE